MSENIDYDEMPKVLVTWLVKTKNGSIMHNQSRVTYAKLVNYITRNRRSKGSIDFSDHGWWPIEDYTFIKPEHLGDIVDYLTEPQRKFAEKHGIWVMFVEPVKAKSTDTLLQF